MARAAAPYVHPRLAAIEHSVEQKAVSEMTDAELDAEIARVAVLLGFADSQKTPPEDPLRLQSHAEQLTHAPQPSVWSADKERESVPIARNDEHSMPDARRNVARRPEGK